MFLKAGLPGADPSVLAGDGAAGWWRQPVQYDAEIGIDLAVTAAVADPGMVPGCS